MDKKQTAVEWLVEQFQESHSYINKIFEETINQAKQMEKEQIEVAYWEGRSDEYQNIIHDIQNHFDKP